MRHVKWMNIALSTALAVCLAVPAYAAGAPEESAPVQEETAAAYEVVQRGQTTPVRVWGQAAELGEDSLTLVNDSEGAPYESIILDIGEDTMILDAVTGEVRAFSDIRQDETLYAWVSPAMTKSLPPITTAELILCGIAADYGVPSYAEVLAVEETEDGLDVYVSDQMILHLGTDTQLLAGPGTTGEAALTDIVPGTRLLSWYSVVGLSYPAQAAPEKVMLFPSSYDGWVSTEGLEITVNGEVLSLTGANAPRVEDGHLLVPLRALAETLGCQVTWEPYTDRILVEKDGRELYRLTLGEAQAIQGEVTVGLLAAPEATDGVTFVVLDDLISLHGLKLSQGF